MSRQLKIIQVLPALNSGGVERGTLDFARFLVQQGHESLVISSGGRLVTELEEEGSQHITFPIHKKSLFSLRWVRPLRKLLVEINPDVIHVRSRLPAWLVWLALKNWPLAKRPTLVSTFHGLYSVNRYSAIMGCGDKVIAISHCVRDYIVDNYPTINPDKITVVHRGVDTQQFNSSINLDHSWSQQFFSDFPNAYNKYIIMLPGRLSPWKGQQEFIQLIAGLHAKGIAVHGLIVGEITPGKEHYLSELKTDVRKQGLESHISFTGHRADMSNLYKLATVVVNLSQKAEPFGRTVIESLAVGTPVVAFNVGGPAESLQDCLPQGLAIPGDLADLIDKVGSILENKPDISLPEQFTLNYQARQTLNIYRQAIELNCDPD